LPPATMHGRIPFDIPPKGGGNWLSLSRGTGDRRNGGHIGSFAQADRVLDRAGTKLARDTVFVNHEMQAGNSPHSEVGTRRACTSTTNQARRVSACDAKSEFQLTVSGVTERSEHLYALRPGCKDYFPLFRTIGQD